MITAILSKLKLCIFAVLGAIMAGIALWGNLMASKAEKYEQKAREKTKEAEDATELANTHSDLAQARQQARTERNEILKDRSKEQPPSGLNFNRSRMHKDRDKD